MRSIGKVKIRKLKVIIREEYEYFSSYVLPSEIDYSSLYQSIENRIPESWYDTWESAHSEIQRIINDTITEYRYKK